MTQRETGDGAAMARKRRQKSEGLAGELRRCLSDPAGRTGSLAIAVLLVLGGVARSYLELSLQGAGCFPMPGDNVVMLACCALPCLVAWGPPRLRAALGARAGRVLACGLALVAVALLAVVGLVPAALPVRALSVAGVLARVASLVGLLALWAAARPTTVPACATQMALGLGIAVAFDVVCQLLAPLGVALAGLALPVALWALLARAARLGAQAAGDDVGGDPLGGPAAPCGPSRAEADDASTPARACVLTPDPSVASDPVRFPRAVDLALPLALLALYGLTGGLASSQAFSVGASTVAAAGVARSLARDCLLNDVGLALGGLALLAGARWLVGRGSDPLVLRCVMLPAYLVAIFLTPLMGGHVALLVPLLMAFSQGLFYGLLWMFPRCVRGLADSTARLAAASGCFFAGTYAGMWFGGDLLPTLGSGDLYMVAAAVVLGVVLGLELLPHLLGSREPMGGPVGAAFGALTSAEVTRDALAAGTEGIERLADLAQQAWGLTPRERAVLPGLARGRSIAWVADALTLSRNTVHTHVRNIYQKAGVHSQQELIDAVEALAKGQE